MKKMCHTAEFFILLVFPVLSWGDVILDGSMGMEGAITGPEYAIEAGYGRLSGSNLFHSFSKFDIGTGEIQIGAPVEMVTRKLYTQGDEGLIIYGYKFGPCLKWGVHQ